MSALRPYRSLRSNAAVLESGHWPSIPDQLETENAVAFVPPLCRHEVSAALARTEPKPLLVAQKAAEFIIGLHALDIRVDDDGANRVSTDARRLISDYAYSANAARTTIANQGSKQGRVLAEQCTGAGWAYWLSLRISTANRIRSAVRATPSFVRNWPAVLATVL